MSTPVTSQVPIASGDPADRAQAAPDLLDEVGPAFSRLRRAVALSVEEPVSRKELTRALAVGLVEEGQRSGRQEVTVGMIGELLQVDPSAASRIVSDCIGAGYLRRVASPADGRRIVLELTDEGRAMLAGFRRRQRSAYERITRGWPEQERQEFARLLIKYVDSLAAVHADTP